MTAHKMYHTKEALFSNSVLTIIIQISIIMRTKRLLFYNKSTAFGAP